LAPPFAPLLPAPVGPADEVPLPPLPATDTAPPGAAATPPLPGITRLPISRLQPSAARQSPGNACANNIVFEPTDGAAGAAGFVCAPAIAAYRLTATANTARRVPSASASPFCFFISFS
jgi:hypothetical protein